MERLEFNSRPVQVEEIQFERDIEDTYIIEAYYLDTEMELSIDELEQLTNENQDWLYSETMEYWQNEADYFCEGES